MRQLGLIIILSFLFIAMLSCDKQDVAKMDVKVRGLADTVGFAHLDWQMDSLMQRIQHTQGALLEKALHDASVKKEDSWKVIISPHDDYTYVGYLYPAVMENLKANTVFLFGVAHKAKKLGLENQIVFDSFDFWQGPYGRIKVSELRNELIKQLPDSLYIVNDEMEEMEHSLEALLPFMQYYNRHIQIIPILVPYISSERMAEIAKPLAAAIHRVTGQKNMRWGVDFALAISTDAVHYGDAEWGGKNFAFFGSDPDGYKKAIDHEHRIIDQCLVGKITPQKVNLFTKYTVKERDFRQYKWTWCGRYSVPFGLLTSFYLQGDMQNRLAGHLIGYANSIDHPHIKVDDLRMGITANANKHHWVGYASIAYH